MYCDRCGKEFAKWNHKHLEEIGIAELVYDDGHPYPDTQKDLCESCYTELEKWWNCEADVSDTNVGNIKER